MSTVPIKFSANTYRVKSVSFHPTRPWLLVGLANGNIQIWDYRLENLLHTYSDCGTSPIRCVLWHPTQPLFAASGDDQLIRIFNYQKKICLFALQGHNDYVRSLQFHHEQPWLLSASDDQTIRIWNWQSRSCICEILGHHYYVMDAKFHPHLPLIATASLDNTLRIWNYAQLLNRQSGSSGLLPPSLQQQHHASSALDGIMPDVEIVAVLDQVSYINSIQWYYHQPTEQTYLFFAGKESDIRVFTLSAANYSTYHHETLRLSGHSGSITGLAISQQSDTGELLSTSEDGTAKVWTPTLSNGYLQYNVSGAVQTPIKREDGQCWCGAIDSANGKLFAVGYETGFCLFKLTRERYGYGVVQTGQHSYNGKAYWMNNKKLMSCDLFNGGPGESAPSSVTSPSGSRPTNTQQLLSLSPTSAGDELNAGKDPLIVFSTKNGQNLANAPTYVRAFYINQHQPNGNVTQILFTKGGVYNIINIQHSNNANAGNQQSQQKSSALVPGSSYITSSPDSIQDVFTGQAKFAVFATQQRIILLTRESELILLSTKNEKKRTLTHVQLVTLIKNYIQSVNANDDSTLAQLAKYTAAQSGNGFDEATLKQYTPIALFPALPGHILIRIPEYLLLFDANNFSIVSDFILPSRLTVKRILWSSDFQSLVICTKTLIYYAACTTIDGKKTLSLLSTHAESSRIKSICFDKSIVPTLSMSKTNPAGGNGVGSDEVILFNTSTHLKYLLKNGHVGVLKTFHDVCYISALTDIPPAILNQQCDPAVDTSKDAKGKKKVNKQDISIGWTKYDKYLHYFTRQGKYCVLRVNCIEYLFKFALENRITPIVAEIMFSGLLNGDNVIFYVCDMGYYDLALHLSTDLHQKFILSLQCGNLKDAIDCAMTLNQPSVWNQLSVFALNCGNIVAVEQAYINTKNIHLLAFLYILTGQVDKLQKIMKMCLATPPGVSNDRQINDNAMKYELGLWISFLLGQHSNTIHSLYSQLTHSSSSADVASQLECTNGIHNKGTILALLRCVLQAPVSLTTAASPSRSHPQDGQLSETHQDMLQGITQHLNEMNAAYKDSSAYESHVMMHQANPANLQADGSTSMPSTWYDNITQRPADCIANYPLDPRFIAQFIQPSIPTSNSSQTHDQSQSFDFGSTSEYIKGDLEGQFIDSLLQCTEMTFDRQAVPGNSIEFPRPNHLSPLTTSLRINHDATDKALLSPWAYLMNDDQNRQDQVMMSHISSFASQPWPLLAPQQVQQFRQKHSSKAGVQSNHTGLNTITSIPSDDADWFADILSHAEGLSSGTAQPAVAGTINQARQGPEQVQSQQDTWDLDLDIDDSDDKADAGADFMNFDSDPSNTQGLQANMPAENLLLLKCGQFITQPKNDSIVNHSYWANSVQGGSVRENPYEVGTQTQATSRLFAINDFNAAFYTLSQQISPNLTIPAATGPSSTNSLFVRTTALNSQFSNFLYPSPYLSLNQIDNAVPEADPAHPDFATTPPLMIPLQHTVNLPGQEQQQQQQQQGSSAKNPLLGKSIVPFNPITLDTIKDRYGLAVQYLFKGQNEQAVASLRSILHILPLTSLLSSSSSALDKRFMQIIPHMARELIISGLIEQMKAILPPVTTPSPTSSSSSSTPQISLPTIVNSNPAIIKAIYGVISTFTSYTEQFTTFSSDQGFHQSNQHLFDIMLNTLWLACKYLYPLNNFQMISHLCRKVIQLAQQYNGVYQPTLVNLDVVRKMIKKCEQESFKDNTPLTFQYSASNPNQVQLDFNALTQLSQQTQHINAISFTKAAQDGVITIPKGINLIVCSQTFSPITTSQQLQQHTCVCSFCYAVAVKPFNNKKCNVCQLGTYGGVNTAGLQYE